MSWARSRSCIPRWRGRRTRPSSRSVCWWRSPLRATCAVRTARSAAASASRRSRSRAPRHAARGVHADLLNVSAGRSHMGLIGFLVVGLVAGFIARFLVPGPDPMGWLGTLVLGLIGTFVGGALAALLFCGPPRKSGPGVIWSRVRGVLLVRP